MFICLLQVVAAVASVLVLAWFVTLLLSDADVSLILRTKIGKQPASLFGKVVWVTGASSGIGEFYAYCLAESGCKLVLSARRRDELDRVKEACLALAKCKIQEKDILVLPLDVTDFDSHGRSVHDVLKYFGKVDILINNAGRSQKARWMDIDLSVDRHMYDVNVLGPVSLTQAVLPHMIERKEGHIVVVGSLAGKSGIAGMRSYTGAKHAVQGYFDSLRTEMSDSNIDVTVICPGPVFSDLFLHAATGTMGDVVGTSMAKHEKRMTTERCAYLSCVAIANRQYETWLALNPVLLSTYISQFAPSLVKWAMCKLGAEKVMALREGK